MQQNLLMHAGNTCLLRREGRWNPFLRLRYALGNMQNVHAFKLYTFGSSLHKTCASIPSPSDWGWTLTSLMGNGVPFG